MDLKRLIRDQWDRAAAILAAVIGVVALLLGWIGVSGKSLPAAQIPYLASGAVFGIFLLGLAATLWLSADLRDEWSKLDEIHAVVTDLANREAQPAPAPAPEPEPAPAPEPATGNGRAAGRTAKKTAAVPKARSRTRASATSSSRRSS
jgi:hypothetical protein